MFLDLIYKYRESKIPVMSDTLLPSPSSSGESSLDAPAGTQNQRFSPPDPTVEPKVEPKEPTHIHPRPGSQRIFAPIEGATRPRHSLPLPRRSLSQSIIKPPPSSPSSSQISASQSQILPSLLGHTPSPRPSHVLPTPPPSTREGTVSESPATETSPSALLALKNTTAKAEPNPEKELEIGSTSTSELTIFGLKPNTTSGGDSCSESEVNAQLETEELLGSSSSEIRTRE